LRDIATLMAAIAERGGDLPAVVDASDRINYAEFEAWSNDLANRIVAAIGTEPQVCLVVAGFDRKAIVATFATLKTPHYFVALDRENLPANIAEIAGQLEAALVVYADEAEETVRAANLSVPVLSIGSVPEGPVQGPAPLTDLNRIATYKRSSGSTGGAKSAAYSAEAILIDSEQGARVNDIVPGAGYALVSTFDSAMSSAAILRCILAGATLMPVDLRFESPKRAVERLTGDGFTHVHATPTAFRLLTQGLAEGATFPDVHSIFLSGEKSTQADVRLIAKTTKPECRLRAAFSSSETQLVAHTTVYPAQEPGPEDFAELNLFSGVRIAILDEDGNPKPAGDLGRVRITSKMVSHGYRGDVDPAVAARFTANDDGSRSFLTDDMGYLTRQGRLVLTSRAGREVKIRGRRVDLGELETWLTRQEDIAEAAVVVQPLGHDGSPRLASFIKVEAGFESTSALRKRMQGELIASMQPAAIVVLDELPRTPNQKINRRALESDLSHLDAEGSETLEAEGLLGQVAKIWASVLKRPVTGAEKDFFDLGGDSIAATVTAVAMEDALGLPVDTGFVYRYPVLAEQVHALQKMDAGTDPHLDRLLVPLTIPRAAGDGPKVTPPRAFLISGAGGHVFPFAPVARELQFDWDILGILHPGILDSEPTLDSIPGFADRMGKAIRASQPEGPYYIIGYSFGAAVAHEVGRRLADAGETVGVVIVDLQLLQLATLRYKAWYAREKIERIFGRKGDKGAQPGFLEDPNLDPVEKAKLSISIRNMASVLNKYRPFKTKAPTVVITAEVKDEPYEAEDLGWSKVARLVKVTTTPGNHLEMFKDQYMKGFAQLLDDCLHLLEKESGAGAAKRGPE